MKRALITGITGQDGSFLAEFLLEKGYNVYGMIRSSSLPNTSRIKHLTNPLNPRHKYLTLLDGDLSDTSSVTRALNVSEPDEIYNLAAQSHVGVSFNTPELTADVNALGTLRLLENIKNLNLMEKTRFYQASTSELFGLVQHSPQNEKTPFYPRSPYAVAKLFSYWITVNYREAYGLYACNGILFNHESTRRGENFVTRKITKGLASIALGKQECLKLGNLDAKRDWGHAKDYVEMQWLMLQQKEASDYVIASGKQHTVRQFTVWAAETLGIELEFTGEGLNEIGVVKKINGNYVKTELLGREIIRVDEAFYRPAEVDTLLGNADKARNNLGWFPKTTAKELCAEMVLSDYKKMED